MSVTDAKSFESKVMTQRPSVTCPNCDGDRIEARSRGDDTVADDYICLACGHKFDLEDIARQIIKKTREGGA